MRKWTYIILNWLWEIILFQHFIIQILDSLRQVLLCILSSIRMLNTVEWFTEIHQVILTNPQKKIELHIKYEIFLAQSGKQKLTTTASFTVSKLFVKFVTAAVILRFVTYMRSENLRPWPSDKRKKLEYSQKNTTHRPNWRNTIDISIWSAYLPPHVTVTHCPQGSSWHYKWCQVT